MATMRALAIALAGGLTATAAQAGLEICNDTEAFQSVAIGYLGDEDWTSEGWWLIEPGGCVEPLPGELQQRYYYYRAVVEGGDFQGDGYLFCVETGAFTIVGDAECEARGYSAEDFREIDTGETAVHHVERITAVALETPTPDAGEAEEPEVAEVTPVVPDDEPEVVEEDDFFDDFEEDDFGFDGPDPRRGGSRL